MLVEWGHFALILGLLVALWQSIVPILAIRLNQPVLQLTALSAARTQCVLMGVALLALASAFLSNDFSVLYVAQHSNSHMPWIYRFCALWGAHEGSFLLWLFILTLWMSAVSVCNRELPLSVTAWVLAILSWVAVGFYIFLLTSSDPFVRQFVAVPNDGASLNPILQDPGLVAHPPILYMGYVGFSVAFAFALTALITGKLDASWARYARPWTLAAWSFLTVGIVLGSWWAYRELGWGGFWFWDPVENASLLPWLVGTALIHSLMVSEKRDAFKAWTVLLAITAFALSLLGTFLVRSGVLISVHAFAEDPKRGLTLLVYLMIVVGGSLGLYALRGAALHRPVITHWRSREALLLSNNVLLFGAMMIVLLGTVYPLIMASLHLANLSVGAPYFNTVLLPFVLLLAALMGLAPYLTWLKPRSLPRLRHWLGFALICLSIMLVCLSTHWNSVLVAGLLLAAWVLHNHLRTAGQAIAVKRSAMVIAHCGFAFFLSGVVLDSTLSQQSSQRLRLGDKVSFSGVDFYFAQLSKVQGPNYQAFQARFELFRQGSRIATLLPQMRLYPHARMAVSKTAISATVWRDWVVALGNVLPDGSWAVRLYYKPFVRWIWWGGLLMAFAGAVAIVESSLRQRSVKRKRL